MEKRKDRLTIASLIVGFEKENIIRGVGHCANILPLDCCKAGGMS